VGAYHNRRIYYTEHLVFALHVHTFWFVMLGVAQVPWEWVKFLAIVSVPVYTLWAMAIVYAGRLWPRLLRAGLVSLLYGITLVITMSAEAIWAVLF
jgi:hypothetical protein